MRLAPPSIFSHAGTRYAAAGMFTLDDLEAHAREADENAWNFFSSGADQEQTLRDNVEAFKR